MKRDLPLIEGDLMDEIIGGGFPTIRSPVEALIGQYNKAAEEIEKVSSFINNQCGVFGYFAEGARQTHNWSSIGVSRLFDKEAALRALDCHFWDQALKLTDVLSFMPAKRRNAWTNQIHTGFCEVEEIEEGAMGPKVKKSLVPIPAFHDDAVRSTLQNMLASRSQFFAERVDGLWDALSDTHLTNQPQAFGKRMILKRVIAWSGYLDRDMANYIHDLRAVIARFMGRDEPTHNVTHDVLDRIVTSVMRGNGSGKWHVFDGGAFKVRLYKVGTAHMEIHPDMAWRLNAILASLHPMAIPSEFRKKPQKPKKAYSLVHDLVPFEVIHQMRYARSGQDEKSVTFYGIGEPLHDRSRALLLYLGGVQHGKLSGVWQFDYPAIDVLHEICMSGQIPEQKAFQFYPTPESLAQELVSWADIRDSDEPLEPSAGQGGLADLMPKDRTVCVEISQLHCKVLESKGFNVVQADFLEWNPGKKFSRIVMNPPFSDGRAEAHLKKAASLLEDDGVLVAILPSGFKDKLVIDGRKHEYSTIRHNEFKGASVSVVMLKLS